MEPINVTEAPAPISGRMLNRLFSIGFNSFSQRLTNWIKQGFQFRDAYILTVSYETLKEVPRPAIEVEIKELTDPDDNELDDLAAFNFHTNSREDVLRYLAEGQQCFVAKHQGRVISAFWVQKKEFYDFRNQRSFQLADNEEYVLGGFTKPEFRGNGIPVYTYETALRERHRLFPDLKTVIFVDVNNRASLKMVSKLGFQKVGRNSSIRVFGVRFKYLLGRNVLPNTKRRFIISI